MAREQYEKAAAAETRSYAQRFVLTYTGAVLEARDNVIELAETLRERYGSVGAAQKQIDKAQRTLSRDLTKFERRGEREVAKARTRVERELRLGRRAVEERARPVTTVVGGTIKVTGNTHRSTGEQVKPLV